MMVSSNSSGDDVRFSSKHRVAITLLVVLFCTMLFFRSILPRLSRLFLQGRLRIKRVGFRGIRGLEWRSKGFKKSRPAAFDQSDDTTTTDEGGVKEKEIDGLILQVKRIYPIVRIRNDTSAGSDSTISKTWITIRVEGVGITLPQSEKVDDKVKSEKAKQEQDALLKLQEAEKREKDAENARLEYLMQSRPASPMLGSSANFSRPASPMPAFATFMSQTTSTAPLTNQPQTSTNSPSRNLPSDIITYTRNVILPMLQFIVLNSLRTILYLIISALPFLTSIIDIQMIHLEVYSLEAEAVIRVEKVGLGLDMSLIPSRQQARKAKKTSRCVNIPNRWTEMLYSMPNRIGSGAKGAASFVTDGLPAGRISIRLYTSGLQVIEATIARRSHSSNTNSTSTATTLTGQSSQSRPSVSSSTSSSAFTSSRLFQRSKSSDGVTSVISSGDEGAGDWSSEAIDSKFLPITSWLDGSKREVGEVTHSSARVVSMPETSSFQLGVILSGSSSISSKESVHIGVNLCKTTIGVDALYKVFQSLESRKALRSGFVPSEDGESGTRSQISKHIKQQKPEAQAQFLEKLGSASFNWPAITLVMSSKVPMSALMQKDELIDDEQSLLPSSVQMLAEIKGISLSVQTSNPADKLHQKWLGTCGVKGYRHPTNAKAFADRFRWNQSRLKVHVEHRRAFHVEAKVDNVNIKAGIDGEATKLQSELLNLGDIQLRIRTTWTPFGLLSSSSSKDSTASAQRFFQGDPNEQAVILEISLGRLVGDLQSRHATALLAFAQNHQVERKARRKELKLQEKTPKRPAGYLESLPKYSMGIKLTDLSYRLDASDILPATTTEQLHSQKSNLSLVIAIPDISFALHASYVDQYIRRSEQERKAAWKSLQNDQLEWSLNDDVIGKSVEEGKSIPREVGGEYKTWREDKDRDDDDESDSENEANKKLPEPMTIFEAIQRMKELQAAEEINGDVNKRRAFTAVNKWKKLTKAKVKAHEHVAFNTRYVFESQCTVGSVEVFWVMKNGEASTRRKTFDAKGISTAEARLPTGLTKLHMLGLSCFEASTIGHLPGFQDIVSDAVKLETGKLVQDVRVSLEDVDIDMWNSSAIDATRQVIGLFARPRQLNAQVKIVEDKEDKEEEATEAPPRIDFISILQAGTSVYISIGSIVAHVGGVDERCDHTLSRGVGFEGKRAVIEMACSSTGSKKQSDAFKSGLGARSSLDLPEDLTSSCNSLATRHGKAAMAKLSLFEFGLFPILDGEQASDQHLNRSETSKTDNIEFPMSPSIFAPAVWDFQDTRPQTSSGKQKHAKYRQQDRSNFIFWMPFSSTKVNLIPKGSVPIKIGKKEEEVSITTEGTRLLSFKIELLHTYCILMAFATLKNLLPSKNGMVKSDVKDEIKEEVKDSHAKDKVKNEILNEVKATQKAKKPSRFNQLSYNVRIKVDQIQVSIALPDDVNVFCHIRRLEHSSSSSSSPQVGFEKLMAAVQSSRFETNGGIWEEAVRMRDVRVDFDPKKDDLPMQIHVQADGIMIKVPFNYQVHPLIDGTIVSLKATRQLLHQFIKGGTDSIITPVPEKPKHLPIIKVKIRAIAFAGDDDPFETRLNIIWRAGGDENQARYERDAAFREKARQMEFAAASQQSTNVSMMDESIESDGNDVDDTTTAENRSRKANEAKVSLEQAREALDAFNGSSWIRRYRNAKAEQGRREDALLKAVYGRLPVNHHLELPIKLAPDQRSTPLFRSTWSDFTMEIGPTSFPDNQLRDFLFEQGSGMPKDMEYSLMVPMHLRMTCSEWKINLRDYPLPMLHVPPINVDTQPRSLPAFEMEADICIAEQMSDFTAVRQIPAIIVPASTGRAGAIEYGISIPRMAMPTKMFGSPIIKINTAYPTRIVWGQSIQPAIHDVVRVIEGITSPPHDPSPRIGFWDKLSLILHGRVHFQFPGDGELHIYLKGSRDPYHILEHGAGWVKCWRGDVELKIGFENEQREVFQIMSQEYLLAIPDLKDYIDRAATGTGDRYDSGHPHARYSSDRASSLHSGSSQDSSYKGYKTRPDFKKVCLKLTNGVRWGAGLLLESTCTDDTCCQEKKCKGAPFYRECRFWTRKKHWEVYQRSKDYADTLAKGEFGDSYKGWRSHHLHFSLSIYSFKNGPIKTNDEMKKMPEGLTNNLYFSPLAWEHFWAWFRLFNSALSLPIREGKLFPGSMEQSPKFGRFLATIKYRFDISPMYITHVYIQDTKSDWAQGFTTLLGVKARMGQFHFDLHQRQQEMLKFRPEWGESKKVFHKPFYEAEIDLGEIDLRTLAAQFVEPERQLFPHEDDDDEDDSQQKQFDVIFGTDQDCKVFDRDLYWHDLSDFVELDWAPAVDGKEPKIRLLQALTCPRFNYYRRIESQREREARAQKYTDDDSKDSESTKEGQDDQQGDVILSRLEKSKFGKEGTHSCLVGEAPNIGQVQKDLAKIRLDFLIEELEKLKSSELNVESEVKGTYHTHFDHENIASTQHTEAKTDDLVKKIKLIEEYLKLLDKVSAFQKGEKTINKSQDDISKAASSYLNSGTGSYNNLQNIFREWETFDNRYLVHNPSIFYSNATRDVLLKYYISSRKRKGIVHSLSAKAVRYIRDLGKSEDDSNHPATSKRKNHPSKEADDSSTKSTTEDGPELLRELLRDTMQYIVSDELENPAPAQKDTFELEEDDPSFGISNEFEVRKSNVCVLLKPQIVLRSLADDKSTVILTAIRTRIHNYSVKDPRVEEDSVNERVMYRNYASIDGLQAFHPSKTCAYLGRAKQRYGFLHVPLETLIDLKYETRDFERIAPRTNAHMHYDKFNRLRLHDSNRPLVSHTESQDLSVDHLRHRMDLIRLRCPRFAVLANSEHFGASYNIVTDLLLFRDPAYREYAKKLEVMMFSYDFSDLETLASIVQALQVRIRHAKELHVQYHLHFQHLNEQGRVDLLALKGEIKDMVEELALILEAIKISDDNSGSDKDKKSALRVEAQANDITWNMMGHEEGELVAKLTIKGASFTWLNKADNSAAITLSIMDLNAVNVAPNAVFTEIISKYNKVEDHPMRKNGMLLNAIWSVLAPVGGIAIIDYLEIALHPLQIQLEKKIGRQLEDYLFGSKREREKKDREQREVEEAMQEEVNGKTSKRSALKRLTNVMKGRDSSRERKGKDQQDNLSNSDQKPGPRRSVALRKSSKSLSTKSSSSDIRSSHRSTINLNIEDTHSGESDSDETGQAAIVAKQALEMRNRASRNTTFVNAKVFETIFCLSYKGEKQKSITDLYDLVFKAPRLEYRNRTWANADLANHLKKDILKAAWNQKSTLLRGVIHHRRPRRQAVADNIRAIRDVQLNRLGSNSSDVAYQKMRELEEGRKEGIDDLDNTAHPAFRLNVESPDTTTTINSFNGESGEENGSTVAFPPSGANDQQQHHLDDSIEHADSEDEHHRQGIASTEEHRSNSLPGGPKSFGKLIAKTLGNAKNRRSSSAATTIRSRTSSQPPVDNQEEQTMSSDSDSQGDSSPDEDDEDEDDASNPDNDVTVDTLINDNHFEGGTSLDSPHSSRSMRSALTSRFVFSSTNPTASSPPLEQPNRKSSGGILGNLSPSMAKIHVPWSSHRRESGDATPPRSSSPLAHNGNSHSPLLQNRTSSPEQERE